MKPNKHTNSESQRRNKFIGDLKSRPVNKDDGFWQSRPLGCGFGTWMVLIVVIGVTLLYTGIRLYILNR